VGLPGSCDIREALDEVVLVGDLAALVLRGLLGGSDLLGGGAFLASDLLLCHRGTAVSIAQHKTASGA
jgi:hypothetical protein